ncbi:MAG: septal ring lytic transglycosylase RlpA family protein [Terracidiphilus sp.]
MADLPAYEAAPPPLNAPSSGPSCQVPRSRPQPQPQAESEYPAQPSSQGGRRSPAYPQTSRIPATPIPGGGVTQEDLEYVATHRPIHSEQGLATWYTAPYKGRRTASGQVFRDSAMTAAHRTLPMGSLVVVTNLRTGESSPMRIDDRGPFVDGRIVDLTIAAAKATGVFRVGTAQVRVDVYQTPKPINHGGRWCVQIGAFTNEHQALRLKSKLMSAYPDAQVIEFPGEASYWVRIRPQGDDRQMSEYIAQHLRPAEGEAFLTRLD